VRQEAERLAAVAVAVDVMEDANGVDVEESDAVFAEDEFDAPSPGFGGGGRGSGGSGRGSGGRGGGRGGGGRGGGRGPPPPSQKRSTFPSGYVGPGAFDYDLQSDKDGAYRSPFHKYQGGDDGDNDNNYNYLLIEPTPRASYDTRRQSNVMWDDINDIVDEDTLVNYERLLRQQLGVESFEEETEEEEAARKKKEREDKQSDSNSNSFSSNADDDDVILNMPHIAPEQVNRVVKAGVSGMEGMNYTDTSPSKFELFRSERPHPESRREPKPWILPTRQHPSVEWVEGHVGFLHARGFDVSTCFGDDADSDNHEVIHASLDDPDHRRRIAQEFANLMQVDVGHVSPTSLTSAFIGYDDLADAQRAIRKFQSKPLKSQNVQVALASDVDLVALGLMEKEDAVGGGRPDIAAVIAEEAVEEEEEKEAASEDDTADKEEVDADADAEGEEETVKDEIAATLAPPKSNKNKLSSRVTAFMNGAPEGGGGGEGGPASSILLLTHLELPSRGSGREYLLRQLGGGNTTTNTNNMTKDDVLVLSPTTAMLRLASPQAAQDLLQSPEFQSQLQATKGTGNNGTSRSLTLLKAQRERVFDKYWGFNREYENLKLGKRLLVEGDAPPDAFFRSHFDIIRVGNLPTDSTTDNITAESLSKYFQQFCGGKSSSGHGGGGNYYHDAMSSVNLVTTSDGRFLGHAFVGFDQRGEAQKALDDWKTKSVQEKQQGLLGGGGGVDGDVDFDTSLEPELHLVTQKWLRRSHRNRSGKHIDPRRERPIDELLDDLHNWEQHVTRPHEIDDIVSFGIPKDVMTQVFRKMRFQNRSYGAIDQERRADKLEQDRPSGARYAEFVDMYVHVLRNCITTPNYPGEMVEQMFEPGDEVDLDLVDGPRTYPPNWEDFVPETIHEYEPKLNDY
jgi:RNA recognition motif-containing protein